MASMHALCVHNEHSHVTDRPSRPCTQKLTWQGLSDHLTKAVSCSDAHMGDVCVTCSTYMATAARPACVLLLLLFAASHHSCKPGLHCMAMEPWLCARIIAQARAACPLLQSFIGQGEGLSSSTADSFARVTAL